MMKLEDEFELMAIQEAIDALEVQPESEQRSNALAAIQEKLERWTEGFADTSMAALKLDARCERLLGQALDQGYITMPEPYSGPKTYMPHA